MLRLLQRLGLMPSPGEAGVPVPAHLRQQVGKSASVSEGHSLEDSLSKLQLPPGVDPSMVPPIPWDQADTSK
jgi:hypothetical protein